MFACYVYALLHSVQTVVLVSLQAPFPPSTQCPVSGVGVFTGSFSALLHSVQSVVLVSLQAPFLPSTQCPVSGVGMFVGSFSALLHSVQSVVLVCLLAPSPPCYTVSSQWCWCVCRLLLRPATQCAVSGVGEFAGSVSAFYTVSSQWCWCVCRLLLRPATQCPVGGVGVFACSFSALLHSVQSEVLVCLQAPSPPCYTSSS